MTGPPHRRPSRAALLPDLLVFVEGLRTEDLYLTYWRRQYRDRVRVEIDPFRGGPLQLVEKALQARRTEARDEKRGRGRLTARSGVCSTETSIPISLRQLTWQ
jgi:hypothetical protein